MPEWTHDDFDAASAMTDNLMRQVRAASERLRDRRRRDPAELYGLISLEPTEIFTADIGSAFDRFTRVYFNALSSGDPVLCANTSTGVVPVDIGPSLGGAFLATGTYPFYPVSPRDFYRVAEDYFSRIFRRSPLTPTAPAAALEGIETAVREFLAIRFSARRSNISQSPGLAFEVSTHSKGLRVHYSPAYFINPHNVFGAPTTPVRQWIQPGRYIFGAVGRNIPLQLDETSHYDIPPQTQAELYL